MYSAAKMLSCCVPATSDTAVGCITVDQELLLFKLLLPALAGRRVLVGLLQVLQPLPKAMPVEDCTWPG